MVPIASLMRTSMRASTAFAVRSANNPALPTRALPTKSRRPIFDTIGSLSSVRFADLSLLSFRHFHREHVRRTKHVRTENNPIHVRCESDIWLKAVVVFREIHEFLCPKNAWPDQIFRVRQLSIGAVGHHLGPEQIDPLAVSRCSDAVGSAAIAGEEFSIGRNIEV